MIIVQLTPEQLNSMIRDAVRAEIGEKPTPQTQPETDEFYGIQQAADFLNIAPATLYGMTSRKEIPFMKRSKRIYFLKSDLIGYLKEGRKKTVSEIEAEAEQHLSNLKKNRK